MTIHGGNNVVSRQDEDNEEQMESAPADEADGREAAGRTDGQDGARCLVTGRDRELMALMAISRYLTTAQANALVRPGKHESVGRRRLFTLAGLAPRARGRRGGPPPALFAPPYLRRLRFRRTTGERVDLWALTRQGEALAAEVLGWEPRVERQDVSEPFREHWAVLTDLFVGLAAPLLARGVRASALPLQWDPCEGTELPWRQYDAAAGKVRARAMVPDAVLALPGARRRYLVECEMGTHSIIASSDEKAGATVRKLERYDEFFGGYDDSARQVTFYAKAFPDNWPAEVLFLVRKATRRDNVNAALARWRAERGRCAVTARAVTLDDALREICPLLGAPAPAPRLPREAEAVHMGQDDVDALRCFYQEALVALGAAGRPLPDELRATALRARAILAREGATAPSAMEAHP